MTTRRSWAALALVVALPAAADPAAPAAPKTGVMPAKPAAVAGAATAGTAAAVPAAVPAKAAAGAGEDAAPALPGRVTEVLAAGDSTDTPGALRENSYFYSAFGTTDPFQSLLAGDFEAKKQDVVDIHTVELVGVIWQPDDIAAMVQDAQGYGYTLRPGDAVKNGTVVSIKRDALVARINLFGQTTQVTLHLQRDDEE